MRSTAKVIPLRQAPFSGKLPRRKPNKAIRSREFLTDKEVAALMSAARKTGRHGQRDAALILIAYRHGLRVSELVSLRWEQIDLSQGFVHVARVKTAHRQLIPSEALRFAP